MRQVIFRVDPYVGYRADVPSLPGCHAAGKTLTEVTHNVRVAVYAHLADLEAHGKPIPPSTVLDIPPTEGIIRHQLLLREDVVQALSETFPDEALPPLLDLVDAYGQTPYERDGERVQIAAIRLSAGDRKRLADLIAAARQDYRDVLSWYGIKFGAYP